MNVKKEAVGRTINFLKLQQDKLSSDLRYNKRKMSDLVDEQTIIKRQIAEIGTVIRGFSTRKDG